MEQHPIPQNISGFQFKLIGDITLKQFAYVASGVLIAYLTTKVSIVPSLLRWPIAGFWALLGFGLAFLPIEERPMDRWLINFFRSIYTPTQFIWKKSNAVPEVLANLAALQPVVAVPISPSITSQPMVAPIPRGPVTGMRPPPPPTELRWLRRRFWVRDESAFPGRRWWDSATTCRS